jgi:hypothetical protein
LAAGNQPILAMNKQKSLHNSVVLRGFAWILAASPLLWGFSAFAAEKNSGAEGSVFQKKLAEPVDILWTNTPLRQALEGLSQVKKVAILIDRRVDPGQKLDVSLKGEPLESALKKIAGPLGLGVSRLGAVVYVGPKPAADRLPSVAATFAREIRGSSKAMQRKCLSTKGFAWEDLDSPRELLARLGSENGVKIEGLEQIPHDLWAAADLPPCSLVDRLTLIAIQFDMTFRVSADKKQLELIPLPSANGNQAPHSATDENPIVKSKPAETESPANLDNVRINKFSVQEKPLGPVLKQLAQRLRVELRIDEDALQAKGISLDQRVSVQVENATVDELFQALLKSTRLTFHRHERVVEIVPAKTAE